MIRFLTDYFDQKMVLNLCCVSIGILETDLHFLEIIYLPEKNFEREQTYITPHK